MVRSCCSRWCQCAATTPKSRWRRACSPASTASIHRRSRGSFGASCALSTASCGTPKARRSRCSAEQRPMHPKALLDQATELLRAVLRFDQPADAVVSAHFRKHHALGARERHALAETVYAVLRQRLLFQHLVQGGRGPLELRLVLIGWQGEARTLQAALDDAERRWLAAASTADDAARPAKLRHNLPDWLAHALHAQLDDAQFDALSAALLQPAPLDLRVNTLKAKRD